MRCVTTVKGRFGAHRAINRLSTRARGALCAFVVGTLAACASAPPKPTEIDGVIQASANMNPSVSQRPSPLLVRVYELKTATAFNNADFVSLYQRDQAELGADLVARDEYVINPGESKQIKKVAAPETRFIGVFGAYRDLDHAKWRQVIAVQPNMTQTIVIRADELAISAAAK